MKTLLLAGTALVLGGQALAADLPLKKVVKAPVVVATRYGWTGCYVGGHIGTGWSRTEISEPTEPFFQFFGPANTPIDVDVDGHVLGGAQVGCDIQFANNWIVGAAGDFSWADLDGQASDPFFAGKGGSTILLDAKTEWLTAATGRIGYVWDRWMLYGKAGAAWAHSKYSIQNLTFWGNPLNFCGAVGPPVPCNPTGSKTHSGWTVGVGLEWAFANNWSVGLEYDHYDFGTRSVTLTDPNGAGGGPVSGPVDVKQRIDAIKLSLNYRFAWILP